MKKNPLIWLIQKINRRIPAILLMTGAQIGQREVAAFVPDVFYFVRNPLAVHLKADGFDLVCPFYDRSAYGQ